MLKPDRFSCSKNSGLSGTNLYGGQWGVGDFSLEVYLPIFWVHFVKSSLEVALSGLLDLFMQGYWTILGVGGAIRYVSQWCFMFRNLCL